MDRRMATTAAPEAHRRRTVAWRAAGALVFAALAGAASITRAQEAPPVVKTVCMACHGEAGRSPAPVFPHLAALNAEYLEKQLKDFLAGKRKNDMMAPALEQLKESELGAIAAYYASQKPAPGAPGDATLSAAGKLIYDDGNTATGVPACSGCHQPEGLGNARYPRLAGQFAAYTLAQMQAFKSGQRTNDRAKVMRAVAERMTEQEMAAVSAYLAGL